LLWQDYGIPFDDANIEDMMNIIKLHAAEAERNGSGQKIGSSGEVVND
jgi:hypothetical protein